MGDEKRGQQSPYVIAAGGIYRLVVGLALGAVVP